MGELGADEIINLDPLPLVADKQVLIGRERLDPLREAPDKVLRILRCRLMRDRLHDAQHVFGAMIDLAHEQVHLLLALLAFSYVRDRADDADGPPGGPGALEMRQPVSFDPADLAVSPLHTIFD